MDLPIRGNFKGMKVLVTHAVLDDCAHTVKDVHYFILHLLVRG